MGGDAGGAGDGEGAPGVPAQHPHARPERRHRRGLVHKSKEPTRLERERHEVEGRIKFEIWCESCVRSRALDAQHRRIPDEERRGECHTSAMDFRCPGQRESPVSTAVLVMEDDHHGCTRAHGLVSKSLDGDSVVQLVRRIVDNIDDTGFKRIACKANNGATLTALRDRVSAASNVEIVPPAVGGETTSFQRNDRERGARDRGPDEDDEARARDAPSGARPSRRTGAVPADWVRR